jgi:mannan endo-1,4-beta-mannosidase
LADTQRSGRHRSVQLDTPRIPGRRHPARLAAAIAAVSLALAVGITFAFYSLGNPAQATNSAPQHERYGLPTTPDSYIGLYIHGVPHSYKGVQAFTTVMRVNPNLVLYYSGWPEPFQADFAATVASHGGIPLVQLDPSGASVAAISAGQYDIYLRAYAKAVRAYHRPVILSFGHEMNGYWYSWGYTHTSPAVFVAAWRHIVTLFRAAGAQNVTWLWTINTIHSKTRVPSPGPWWPGDSYVSWVGIDGYFINSSLVFASVFGPTIVYMRTLTNKPILISETSATPIASQPAKIAELFAGIHLYGLLGFVWFDALDKVDWRISSPAAFAAFRRAATEYYRPAS